MDKQRFVKLWNQLFDTREGIKPTASATAVFNILANHYSLAGRYYHSIEHIIFCLNQLDCVSSQLNEPTVVELALWFHDVVYISKNKDNELASADLCSELVGESPQYQPIVGTIRQLIMDTTHRTQPCSADGRYLSDIDLSPLGRPWEEFIIDSVNVRKESPHLDDTKFQANQKAFFNKLLARSQLYHTEIFADRFEKQARDNLRRLMNKPCISLDTPS